MKILVLGATGLLGQALVRIGELSGLEVVSLARKQADYCIDVTDISSLEEAIRDACPDVLVNAVAIVDIGACEKSPLASLEVNTRPAGVISSIARELGFKSIYISTDHYYHGGGAISNKEDAPINLLNEYARSKYLGECLTSLDENSVVLRTNIVGHRRKQGAPTFAEWAIDALENRKPLKLFDDVFSSPIHVDAFAHAMFKLLEKDVKGVFNLASSEVSSKSRFVRSLAKEMEIELDWSVSASRQSTYPARANSMGLDVSKVENILGYSLPGLQETVSFLTQEWRYGCAS